MNIASLVFYAVLGLLVALLLLSLVSLLAG
jgi:hypothetical protein